MLINYLKNKLNNINDLKIIEINKTYIIYLESLCSSDKINEYILKNLSFNQKYTSLKNNLSSASIIKINNKQDIINYLHNGFTIVFNKKEIIACEVKANLYRNINTPSTEVSINGPKDSFIENIIANLGLIKRRIKSKNLIEKDYFLGSETKTKVTLLYLKNKAKQEIIKELDNKLNNLNINSLIDSEILSQYLSSNNNPLPTILKTERPDRVCSSLLDGKIAILVDNSPFVLILPAYLVDFINPQADKYVKDINVNFFKLIRFLCLIITISLPSIYISIINYNPSSVPLDLLLSFQAARSGVPFPSSIEALLMILICSILRESDIRFPSGFGSSISILGALILGEAAVAANVVSPIMIIIIGVTFITGLIFNSGEMINALRYYRFFILILSIILGLFGFIIGFMFILIHLSSTESINESYLYPIDPLNKKYLFKSLLKKNNGDSK